MKMMRCFAVAAIAMVTALVPLVAEASSSAARLARLERFAGPAVEQIHYYELPVLMRLSDDTMVARTGGDRVYLIKVQRPCLKFASGRVLGLTHAMAQVISTTFDAITVDHMRCGIESIRPVDVKAMDQARRVAAQSGLGAT